MNAQENSNCDESKGLDKERALVRIALKVEDSVKDDPETFNVDEACCDVLTEPTQYV